MMTRGIIIIIIAMAVVVVPGTAGIQGPPSPS
jgi:hypothetical protein